MMQNPEKQCLVCSKPSNGMHFGAMTCRACAAFFRRAVVLKLVYECKNEKTCDLEASGRSICRFCRFEKCKEIGMDSEKVILDYDPTASQKVPVLSSTEEPNLKPKIPSRIFNLKIDFTELTEKVKEIFEVKKRGEDEDEEEDEEQLNDLENLTKGLKEFRAPIWPKHEITPLGKAEISRIMHWLNVRIRKYATWMSHATYLMEHLPMDQKFQVYRTSWSLIRIFERIDMTWKVFGQEMLDENFILVSEDCKMMIDKSLVQVEEFTEFTDQYFRSLFHPFLNKYMEEVARPLSELDLSTEEVVFCMVNILGFDVTDLTPETLEVLNKFKERIGDQMHNYYISHTSHKMYSLRIMKLMKLVKTITAIMREKEKIKELIWIFDVYKAEISDPYFFTFF